MKSISKKWATFSVVLLAITTLLFQIQVKDNTNLSLWGKLLLIFVAFFLLAHTREEKERWKTGFHLFGYFVFLYMVVLLQSYSGALGGIGNAHSAFNLGVFAKGLFELFIFILPIVLFWMFSFLIRDNWSEKILANIHHHRKIALLVFVISFLLFIFLLAVEKRLYIAFLFWLFMIGATGVEYIIRVSQHHKNQKTLEHFVEKK